MDYESARRITEHTKDYAIPGGPSKVLRFSAVIDIDTNNAVTARQVQEQIERLLAPLSSEHGWIVRVWPVTERERDL